MAFQSTLWLYLVLGASAATGYALWYLNRAPWGLSVVALLMLPFIPFLEIHGFAILQFMLIAPMTTVCFVFGAGLGATIRAVMAGPAVLGPPSNPIWHGPVAGILVALTIGPAVLAALPPVPGLRPEVILGSIFSFRPVPPFSLPSVVMRVLTAALFGLVCQLLFGRLQGPVRWVAWAFGYSLLAAANGAITGWLQPSPRMPSVGVPLFANPRGLLVSSITGAATCGVLAVLAAWARRAPEPMPASDVTGSKPAARPQRHFGRRT